MGAFRRMPEEPLKSICPATALKTSQVSIAVQSGSSTVLSGSSCDSDGIGRSFCLSLKIGTAILRASMRISLSSFMDVFLRDASKGALPGKSGSQPVERVQGLKVRVPQRISVKWHAALGRMTYHVDDLYSD